MTSAPTAAALLTYEGRLRSARSLAEIEFLVVNEAFALLPYDQAFLWKPDLLGRSVLAAASGLTEVDGNSPFALWFSRAADHAVAIDAQAPVRMLADSDFPESLNDGAEWIPRHALVVALRTPDGKTLGGL